MKSEIFMDLGDIKRKQGLLIYYASIIGYNAETWFLIKSDRNGFQAGEMDFYEALMV